MRAWTDEEVDRTIGTLLRVGVITSATVVLISGAWYLASSGDVTPDFRIFRGEPSDLRSLRGIIEGVLAGNSRSCIQLGLVLLIATPIARVIFSVVAFAIQRDWTYVVITLIVLSVLLASLLGFGQ